MPYDDAPWPHEEAERFRAWIVEGTPPRATGRTSPFSRSSTREHRQNDIRRATAARVIALATQRGSNGQCFRVSGSILSGKA